MEAIIPVYPANTLNTTALQVPGTYVQIIAPQNQVVNGVPTNNLGIVGTATWGPKNKPVIVGSTSQCQAAFGPLVARKFDLGTVVSVAALQGANVMTCVRVTDGTDTAASVVLTATGTAITFTSLYTGTFGNSIQVSIGPGSAASSYKVTVAAPNLPGEVFDSITGTGNTLWVNIAAAINAGQSGLRGPSQIIMATAGSGTGVPTAATSTLSGGTDGATTITATVLVGSDTAPRTGMYALRGQGCAVGVLADADDNTQWTYQAAFALSEGVYMVGTTVSGDTVSNASTNLNTAGIDTYGFKLMLGDWVQWQDQVNNVTRYVAPSGFMAGLLSTQSPQNSSLNKPIQGVIGTQKTASGTAYTYADVQAIVLARLDVIANPAPGGSYFAALTGHNTSSSVAVHGDNYTRMTNYIAYSINAFLGQYVGKLNTPNAMANVKASGDTFFSNMQQQGQIFAWLVQCNAADNPQSRISQGYLQLDISVTYLSVIEKIVANIQGGQTVAVNTVSTIAA